MKKLPLILLCLPLAIFGQETKEKSKFNFKNSNKYQSLKKTTISNKYYGTPSTFNLKSSIQESNKKKSSYISNSQNNSPLLPFNKGLIHFITDAMQKGKNSSPSIFKKKEAIRNSQ